MKETIEDTAFGMNSCDFDNCTDKAVRHFMGNYYCNYHNKMIRNSDNIEDFI